MASETEASCESDPNFAIICAFLEKFGELCGIGTVDFVDLQSMLENNQEVSPELMNIHIKLLRKTKKNVTVERWERSLVNMCHNYSSKDAWEIERFGYKKTRLQVKLRALKELLEMQFDYNTKFKNEVNKMSAESLRPQPLGRDKLGRAYWFQTDNNYQIRIYKEDPDEETWHLVAKDRDGLLSLMNELTDGDSKLSSDSALNDDSNSLSEKPFIDTGQSEENSNEKSEQESVTKKSDAVVESANEKENLEDDPGRTKVIDSKNEEKKVSEASEETVNDVEEKSSVVDQNKDETEKKVAESEEVKRPMLRIKSLSELMEKPKETKKANFLPDLPELTIIKKPKLESSQITITRIPKGPQLPTKVEVSAAIESPVMIIKGSGSGYDNKSCNFTEENGEEIFVSEEIEEEVMFIVGEGNGWDCGTGNEKEQTAAQESEKSKNADTKLGESLNKVPIDVDKNVDSKTEILAEKATSDTFSPKKTQFFFGPGSLNIKPCPLSPATNTSASEEATSNTEPEESNGAISTENVEVKEENVEGKEENVKEKEENVKEKEENVKEKEEKVKGKEENVKDEDSAAKDKTDDSKVEENIEAEQQDKENNSSQENDENSSKTQETIPEEEKTEDEVLQTEKETEKEGSVEETCHLDESNLKQVDTKEEKEESSKTNEETTQENIDTPEEESIKKVENIEESKDNNIEESKEVAEDGKNSKDKEENSKSDNVTNDEETVEKEEEKESNEDEVEEQKIESMPESPQKEDAVPSEEQHEEKKDVIREVETKKQEDKTEDEVTNIHMEDTTETKENESTSNNIETEKNEDETSDNTAENTAVEEVEEEVVPQKTEDEPEETEKNKGPAPKRKRVTRNTTSLNESINEEEMHPRKKGPVEKTKKKAPQKVAKSNVQQKEEAKTENAPVVETSVGRSTRQTRNTKPSVVAAKVQTQTAQVKPKGRPRKNAPQTSKTDEAESPAPLESVTIVDTDNSNTATENPEKDPLAVSEEETSGVANQTVSSITSFSFDYDPSSPAPEESKRSLRKRGRENLEDKQEIQEKEVKRPKIRGKRSVDQSLRKSVEEKRQNVGDGSSDENEQPKKEAKAKGGKKVPVKKKVATPAASDSDNASQKSAAKGKKGSAKNARILKNLGVKEEDVSSIADSPAPVRQSRRLAQIKIKEDATRRRVDEDDESSNKKKKKSDDKVKKKL